MNNTEAFGRYPNKQALSFTFVSRLPAASAMLQSIGAGNAATSTCQPEGKLGLQGVEKSNSRFANPRDHSQN
jgi:hypothetical protein